MEKGVEKNIPITRKLQSNNKLFFIFLLVVNLWLALNATPVTDFGDAPDYIEISKAWLGEVKGVNFAHRSPLYSIIMAGFMLIFDDPVIFKMIVVFQYLLVAISCYLIYQIFLRLFVNKFMPAIIALAFNFSLPTIFYANIMLAEILAAFLFIVALYFLLQFFDQMQSRSVLILGTALGLLALARLNTAPLIVTFTVLLMYLMYCKKATWKRWIFSLMLLLIPILAILNTWAVYNYRHYGFYGLFPVSYGGISRAAIAASIRPENRVSKENQPALDIFLETRNEFLAAKAPVKKGSLARLDKLGFLSDIYGGFRIYLLALPKLHHYYQLPAGAGEHELSQELSGFYKEIVKQNRGFIWKLRLYSLLNSFRASSGASLPREYGTINLNILPSIAFKIYKLAFFFVSVVVFGTLIVFLITFIKNKLQANFTLLTMYFMIFSFYAINFSYISESDSNRFKFPADPLIIGLFLYHLNKTFSWAKSKISSSIRTKQGGTTIPKSTIQQLL